MYLEELGKTKEHLGQDMVILGSHRKLKTESNKFLTTM
jgi:hypothetical protein